MDEKKVFEIPCIEVYRYDREDYVTASIGLPVDFFEDDANAGKWFV